MQAIVEEPLLIGTQVETSSQLSLTSFIYHCRRTKKQLSVTAHSSMTMRSLPTARIFVKYFTRVSCQPTSHLRLPTCRKWMPDVNHIMLFLGFLIDAHKMTVTWPLQKRTELRDEILATLKHNRGGQASPIVYASILGKLRSASRISPWGVYITWSIQRSLTQAIHSAKTSNKTFWKRGKVRPASDTCRDLHLVANTLDAPEFSPVWTRAIALLVV